MATATEAPQEDYEPPATERYNEYLNEWMDGATFRFSVYLLLGVLLMVQVVVLNSLYAEEILTEGVGAFQFLFALAGLIVTYLLFGEFVDLLKYTAVSETGKHRGYLVVGALFVILVGVGMTRPEHVPESAEYAEAYRNFAWLVAAAIGLRITDAGLYDSDFHWLQERLPWGETA